MTPASSIKGVYYAVGAGISMGSLAYFVRLIEIDPITVTFFRLLIAAIILFAVMLGRNNAGSILKGFSLTSAAAGALMAGLIACYVAAMGRTSLANAAFLLCLAPLFAAVLAHILLKERLTTKSIIYISIAIIGTLLLFELRFNISTHEIGGMLFGIAAGFLYSLFIIVNRTASAKGALLPRTFAQFVCGSAVLAPFVLTHSVQFDSREVIVLIFIGVIPGALGLLLAVEGIRRLNAAHYGVLSYSEPITALVIGWALFGESLSAMQVAGCALIVAAGLGQTFQKK